MGSHVLDYFKHVSPSSLRDMGLALINRVGSPETLLLFSICVNSAAFKFINTVLSEDGIEEVAAGMRASAARHLESVKLAIARIHLLSAPSLVFLQALLCSVSRTQVARRTFLISRTGIHSSGLRRSDELLDVHYRSMQSM